MNLYKNVIFAYKDYFALVASLNNFLFDIFSFINNLYTFIINYKAIYKPI